MQDRITIMTIVGRRNEPRGRCYYKCNDCDATYKIDQPPPKMRCTRCGRKVMHYPKKRRRKTRDRLERDGQIKRY